MIFIENLIRTDDHLHQSLSSIKTVFGDAFLLKKNKIYRNRRTTAQKLKVKFKKADPSYHIAPMLCLPQIIKSKTVPYVENKQALIDLNIPLKKLSIDDLVFLGVKENHLLHETSHVIMWLNIEKHLNLKNKTSLMTAYLLSESYANYTETIANLFAETELHQDFLKMNSFWSYSQKEVDLLNKFNQKHGPLVTNTTLLLCFLYSNFLYKKISIYECEGIRQFLGNLASDLTVAEIKKIFTIASQLNAHFIMRTGELFWKTLGIKENLFESLDFDPVDFLLKIPEVQKSILELLSLDIHEKSHK